MAAPRARRETGRRGEAAAAAFLTRLGFRIVARNLRTRHGEMDLLVRRRRLYVAVEVKARRGHPAPEQAVTAAQLARLDHSAVTCTIPDDFIVTFYT